MPQLPQKCLTPVKACALRVTRLESDGTAAPGPNNSYVSNKFTEIGVTTELREGAEQELLDGCGCPIVEFKEDDSFKRWTFTVSVGALEFGLLEMMLGTSLILDNSTIPVPIGMQFVTPAACGVNRPQVALEAWSRAIAYDESDPDLPYFHWVWPGVKFAPAPGDLTLGADVAATELAGTGVQNSRFGDPYNELPEDPLGSGLVFLSDDFPTIACGYQTVGS